MREYLLVLLRLKVRTGHVLSVLCLAVIVIWCFLFQTKAQNVVSFLDVGQGDAAFIQLATGEQILIDTGAGIEIMYHLAELMPRLDLTIEAIFISHAHADHVGGLEYILSRYEIGSLFMNICPDGEILDYINNFGDKVVSFYQDSKYFGEEVYVQSLWPPKSMCEMGYIDENYLSQILEVRIGGTVFLFTGDAEFGQDAPIDYAITLPVIDILKVPHHGSRHAITTEFISRTSPSSAIVSVGDNSFGHPAEDVLEILGSYGSQIYRTDLHGSVYFLISDDGYTVSISK